MDATLLDPTLALGVLCALLVGIIILLFARLTQVRRRPGARSRKRNQTAQEGEAHAEALLRRAGYEVIDRQITREGIILIDGEPFTFGVRVDLLVRRGRELSIAEVKTGSRAPDPLHGPTRRQLREYAELFPDCGLLLVDAEANDIMVVEFA